MIYDEHTVKKSEKNIKIKIPEMSSKNNFVCQLCNKKFSEKKALTYHQNQKDVPCNYECRLCGKMCENAKKYRKHMEKDHNNVKVVQEQAEDKKKFIPPKDKEEENVLEMEPVKQKQDPLPIQDFDDKFIRKVLNLQEGESYEILDASIERENLSKEMLIGFNLENFFYINNLRYSKSKW